MKLIIKQHTIVSCLRMSCYLEKKKRKKEKAVFCTIPLRWNIHNRQLQRERKKEIEMKKKERIRKTTTKEKRKKKCICGI